MNAGFIEEYNDNFLTFTETKETSEQMTYVFPDIPNSLYGTIWIDVEDNPSAGCGWSATDFESNCSTLRELVSGFKARGKVVGIYASHYMWTKIFGNA